MTGEIIDLNDYSAQSVVRRYTVSGVLKNIHGEHDRRAQMISHVVFAQEDKERQTDDGSKAAKQTTEARARKREKQEEVHTFPKDDKGNLIVPLGGPHGYVLGALRVAANDLFKDRMKDKNWEAFGIKTNLEHGIFIEPVWLSVGRETSNPAAEPLSYMVQTKGLSGGMMPVYYDYVSEAAFEFVIEVTNPKIPEPIFLQMLAHIQRLGIGPKGRGSLAFTEVRRG